MHLVFSVAPVPGAAGFFFAAALLCVLTGPALGLLPTTLLPVAFPVHVVDGGVGGGVGVVVSHGSPPWGRRVTVSPEERRENEKREKRKKTFENLLSFGGGA